MPARGRLKTEMVEECYLLSLHTSEQRRRERREMRNATLQPIGCGFAKLFQPKSYRLPCGLSICGTLPHKLGLGVIRIMVRIKIFASDSDSNCFLNNTVGQDLIRGSDHFNVL